MKKILSISSSLILSTSSVMVLTTNINSYQTTIKKNINTNINWVDVEKTNNNYFNNIKENYYKTPSLKLNFKENKKVNINNVIHYAQSKVKSYTAKFQNENFNLNQIINTLSKDNPEFTKTYNDSLNQKNSIINTNLLLSPKIDLLKNTDFSSLEKKVNDLKIAKTTFVSISAAAAIAAAGFWAAAWWFGVSVPWAIGSTVTSALAGGIAAGINIALVKYNSELSPINKAIISFSAIYKLGHIFYAILNPLLIGANATATATSWAFPAVLAIIPIVSTILAWIDLFN